MTSPAAADLRLEELHLTLARRFPARGPHQVSWNRPRGGFFSVRTVPFLAEEQVPAYSARRDGVLWAPMSHFYDGHGGARQTRLSISAITPGQIEVGLDRLQALMINRSEQPERATR